MSEAAPLARVLTPRKVLVIGYGNSLRGDDAVGLLAADRLSDQRLPQVTVLRRHVLSVELIDELKSATLALFFDATLDGPPGVVICRRLEPAPHGTAARAHQMQPGELLQLTQQVHGRKLECFLISIRGISFELADEQLTPGVAAVLETMVERARQLIEQHLAARDP